MRFAQRWTADGGLVPRCRALGAGVRAAAGRWRRSALRRRQPHRRRGGDRRRAAGHALLFPGRTDRAARLPDRRPASAEQSRGGSASMWGLQGRAAPVTILHRWSSLIGADKFLPRRRRHRHHPHRRHGERAGEPGNMRASSLHYAVKSRVEAAYLDELAGHARRQAPRIHAADERTRRSSWRDARALPRGAMAFVCGPMRLLDDARRALGQRRPRADRPALRNVRLERPVADKTVHGGPHPTDRPTAPRSSCRRTVRCSTCIE